MEQRKFLTVPNMLSLFRIAMVPVTMVLIFKNKLITAFFAFFIAEATDLVDGHIARKYNQISKFGVILDPLADKAMAVGVIFSFTICGIIPPAAVIILVAKEFLMLCGGFVMLRKGHQAPANKAGKICSFVMNVAIATGFFCKCPFFAKIYTYVIYIGLAFSVFAMVQYGLKNAKLVFGPPNNVTEIESSK